jgi:hypothetical protein
MSREFNLNDLESNKQSDILTMLNQIKSVQTINTRRNKFYEAKTILKPLVNDPKINIGKKLDISLGWNKKAVTSLCDYIQFDGFVDAQNSDSEITGLLKENNFYHQLSLGIQSCLIYSCAFIITTAGDTQIGEPKVLTTIKSANDCTLLFNTRTLKPRSALSVMSRDDNGAISEFNVYFPDEIITIYTDDREPKIMKNKLGEVLVDILTFQPTLDKPFGQSRITKPLMDLTLMAIHSLMLFYVGGEFFNLPQIYALFGTDNKPDLANELKHSYGAIWSIFYGDGERPTIDQLQQQSPTPHIESIRTLANLVSAETDIPINELGFPSDNPPSDASIYAQRLPMLRTAKRAIDNFSITLNSVAKKAWKIANNKLDIPNGLEFNATFLPVYIQSPSASADTLSKLISAMPFLSQTDYPLQQIGLSRAEIKRTKNAKAIYDDEQSINTLLGTTTKNIPIQSDGE